jgi:AmmeMemoRadiSam system protein B/AmmeMemoRadiSam system protein A
MTTLRARGRVRPPAVAGMFYEADPQVLRAQVDAMLAAAGPRRATPMTGVIVPHAGHIYSGPVASSAYRLLPESVQRVLLIGPSHFVPLRSMAASGAAAWQTPLGEVPLDEHEIIRLAEEFPTTVIIDELAHTREHCLEVQLPFLQRVLREDWSLVPFVVGHAAAADVAEVLGEALRHSGTLLVVSTDLSHYLPYNAAAVKDRRTAGAVVKRDVGGIDDDDACGAYALRGALHYAREHHRAVRQLDLRSSGDTAGPRDRVVGYGAFLIEAPAPGVPQQHRATAQAQESPNGSGPQEIDDRAERIVSLARHTIEEALRTGRQSIPSPLTLDPDLREPGAAFVTLRSTATGELMGCVGSLEAHRPLGVDVAAHALDAAFHDQRFAPLSQDRTSEMRVEVSVLSPLVEFPVADYEDLVARVPMGKGVYICAGGYRATYLPSVWDELPGRASFIASLWRKAGLVPGSWPDGISVYTYDVVEFGEPLASS